MAERGGSADTRETDGHAGAFARCAADGDGAAVFLDDFLHRGETEAGSRPLRRKKWLKDFVDDFKRNRRPVVFDEDLIFVPAAGTVLRHRNRQMTTWCHGFAGVLEDAQKHLL